MADKYDIQINEEYRNYQGNECVQLAAIYKNGEEYVPIRFKGSEIKNGYSMAVTFDGEKLLIHMDKTYMNLLYNNLEIVKPLIYHEIGHLENGDFYKEFPKELRMAMLAIHQVLPMELNADAFSANIVGKKAMRKSLIYLLELRKKEGFNIMIMDSQKAIIEELELRIKNLK